MNLDYIQTMLQKVDDKMKESFAHQTNNINNLHVHQCGGTGGWRRAVYLNVTDPSADCPPGWTLTGLSKRTCTRSRSIEWTCDSAFFPVSGGQYNHVCGGIKAYQFGVPRAFQGYRYGQSDIDNAYKWKNHFYEMNGDVGMSLHEKERNKKMPTPRHKVTHNPIPTSLVCFNMLFVCLL